MSKAFASQAALDEKKVGFVELSENACAYTAEGDPNTGVVIGDGDVTRCHDEATQYPDPRIWTAERDVQMWQALEG